MMVNTHQQKKCFLSKLPVLKSLLLFLVVFISISGTYAQNQTVKIKGANIPIKSAFTQIEQQTGLTIAYDESVLNVKQAIKGTVKSTNLKGVLTEVLKGTNSEFVFQNGHIIIRTNKSTEAGSKPRQKEATPQKVKTITGKVTDDMTGESIIGANVVVKGTTTGVITDVDGNFSLSVPEDAYIVISFIGYTQQELATAGITTLSVIMQPDAKALDEVVVVGMNIRQTKRSITGAMATIQTKELKQSPTANLNNALAGKIPGLITVQTSGQPGDDAANMYIRGIATYGSNKSPLIVIDGLPRSEGSFSQIDPNEVETISILKDASSSALYGIQGANGVIVVTTKRGKREQRPSINITSQYGLLNVIRLPQSASIYEYASKYEIIDAKNRGISTPFTEAVMQKLADGTADPYLYPNVNWIDEILKKNSFQQQYNINISGSSNIVHYFVSGSFLHQSTLLNHQNKFFENYKKNSGFNRYNFRSNVDIQATSKLNIQIDLAGRMENRTGPSSGFNEVFSILRWISPFSLPIFNPNGTLGYGSAVQIPYWKNLYGLVTQSGYYENSVNAMYGTISAKQELDFITPGLSLQGFFSFENNNYSNTARTQNFDSYNYKGVDENEKEIYQQYSVKNALSTSGSNYIERSTYVDLRLLYHKKINDHDINLQVLGNRTIRTYNQELPYAYQGISGRIGYGYFNRYFLETNLGLNGSENFPKDKRYGFFPSFSAAWIASDETFLKNINWLKYLKFRASYGTAGNDKIGGQRWMYLTDFGAGGGYSFGESPVWKSGYNEARIGNPFVTWERSKKFNEGFELSLFKNNIISVSFDYFYERRTQILTPPGTVPDYLGIIVLSPLNSGIVDNQGVEGEIRFRKNWKDFGVFANLQMTYTKNKVIDNDQPTPAYPYQDLRGYEVGYQLGYKSLGFFADQHDIDNSPKQSFDNKTIPGDIKYVDINKNGVIDPGDRVPVQMQNVPRWMGGLSFGFTYKGLDISVLLNGAAGGKGLFKPNISDKRSLAKLWTEENKENAKYPIPKEGLNNSMSATDFWMVSTDYLKLRNMEIGYALPLLTKEIKQIRVFLNGQNLAVWDKLPIKDRDPEVTTDAFVYPIQQVFNFGVNVIF